MNRLAPFVSAAALAAASLWSGGCSPLSPQVDPSRFFMLTSPAETGSNESGAAKLNISLGLGPVTLAPYLDRNQLVTRVGPNEVVLSQIDRWAEPLDQNLTRTLAEDLQVRLGITQVVTHPWYSSAQLDYAVEIDVLRFERDTTGAAELLARWVVVGGSDGEVLEARETRINEPAGSRTVAASVAALSRALERLSREIAASIRRLE